MRARISPYGLFLVLLGAVVSTATTCGPPVPQNDVVWVDTARDTGGWRDTEPDPGFTVVQHGTIDLRGVGSVATVTVRATLSKDCLTEVPEYSWGYPTGWVVMGWELYRVPGDTGGDTGPDTAAFTAMDVDTGDTDVDVGDTDVDTGASDADTGTSDTASSDTGTSDTDVDTGPADTDDADTAVDTSDPGDTAPGDTGADPDTSDPGDTGADSGDTDPADTGVPVDTGDTGSLDTADTGDTSFVDTGWGDTGGAPPDGRVSLVVTESDGSTLAESRMRLFGEASFRDSVTTERPYADCGPDELCEVVWVMRFQLVEGEAVHGDVAAHVRLNMCSSGDPETTDLSVVVE